MTDPILVTGGLGNLGGTLVAKLLAKGHAVRVLDVDHRANRRALAALERKGVSGVLGSVTKREDVRRAVAGVRAVAHLAALLPPASERNPAATQAVNVEGTRLLVEEASAVAATMPFALTSSVSVYGPRGRSREPVTAATPVNPTDEYTRSKVAAEEILRGSSLAYVIFRVGASAEGSKLAADSLVMRLMFEIHPEQPMELIHGDDVATAIVHGIERPEAHRKVFPLGGGARCRLTQRELLALTERVLGVRPLPDSAFGKADYYTHFLDDSESQRILAHQHHTLADIERDLRARFGPFAGLLPLFAPISRAFLLRYSGPHRGDPPRPTWEALMASER